MKKVVAVYGAIDRMNYGDLLFPLVFKAAFGGDAQADLQMEYFGLVASNLAEYGALPSRPLREMFDPRNVPAGSSIVIVGGETLSCDWGDAHYYLEGRFSLAQKIVNRAGGRKALNRTLGKRYGAPSAMPYVFKPEHFKVRVRIGHNAVGGSNLAAKPPIARLVYSDIFTSHYISVRDKWTRDILSAARATRCGCAVNLAPDSAILMSQYFPRPRLDRLVSPEAAKIIGDFKPGQYFCLQVKNSLGRQSVAEIADQVAAIHRDLGLPTVLLPIGRAFGHSDHLILSRVRESLRTPVAMPDQNTLFDTMALIANSAAFAGTSLHGAITAISFGVPHFALSAKDLKVPAFLDTWDVDLQRVVRHFDELATGTKAVMQIPKPELQANARRVVGEAHRGLTELAAALQLPTPLPLRAS